jgi:D-hexose-6-phosphate mutarotase
MTTDSPKVEVREGPAGLPFVDVASDEGQATVCLQGAHLTEWHPRSQAVPVTFMSAAVQIAPGKAIRGGIPICWPWFGAHPTNPSRSSHGFARTAVWEPSGIVRLNNGATQLILRLTDTDASRALWPHSFLLGYRITVGELLELELTTTNTGRDAFSYTEALHTYFRIGDIGAVQVLGLEGTGYADVSDGGRRHRQSGAVVFRGEVDRVFLDTESACTIVDPQLSRRIHIAKSGSRSTVVWNPGEIKAAKLADLTAAPATIGGWRQMVCIESANALDNRITLDSGQSHRMSVQYRAEPGV